MKVPLFSTTGRRPAPRYRQLLEKVDAILHQTPEVASFARRTGAEMGFFLTETNRGDYSVRLRPARHRGIEEISEPMHAPIGR